MSEEVFKPAEVCQRLGMPPSTLRIYSTKFAEVLSDSAARPAVSADGKVGYRVYTGRDLVVLKKAKELLNQGLTYDQVLAELRLSVPGRVRARAVGVGVSDAGSGAGSGEGAVSVTPGDLEKVLGVLARAVASAERSAEISQSLVKEIRTEMDELRSRIDRVERGQRREEKRGGFWTHLFGG